MRVAKYNYLLPNLLLLLTPSIARHRLVETLQKVVSHPHSDPIVLDKVAKILVTSISSSELMPFPALVDALLECDEPERGVIILNA